MPNEEFALKKKIRAEENPILRIHLIESLYQSAPSSKTMNLLLPLLWETLDHINTSQCKTSWDNYLLYRLIFQPVLQFSLILDAPIVQIERFKQLCQKLVPQRSMDK
jgi:hypothetical protein